MTKSTVISDPSVISESVMRFACIEMKEDYLQIMLGSSMSIENKIHLSISQTPITRVASNTCNMIMGFNDIQELHELLGNHIKAVKEAELYNILLGD